MILPGHLATTIITLKLIPDPTLIIIANLMIHPLLDAIPHTEWLVFKGKRLKHIIYMIFNILISLFLLFIAFKYLSWSPWFIIAAILANLWLDILDPIARKSWKSLRRFHEYLHSFPEPPDNPVNWSKTLTGKTPTWVKIGLELFLVAISILIVFKY